MVLEALRNKSYLNKLEPPKNTSPLTLMFAQWTDGVDTLLDLCLVKGMHVKVVD